MAKLTKTSLIKECLEGFDRDYHDSLFRQMAYASGKPWNEAVSGGFGGSFPDYPGIKAEWLKIGRSRRILGTQHTSLSKVLYNKVLPEFSDVDKWVGEVRKQFWRKRARQGNWQSEIDAGYIDGDSLGVGGVQVGLTTNPETGMQRVALRHVPSTDTIWDADARTPGQARWVCFVHRVAEDLAVTRYGKEILKSSAPEYYGGITTGTKKVRIFEWLDLGLGGANPTHAIIPGDITNEPLRVFPNTLGSLTWAFHEHWRPSGYDRPVGRILMQMSSQEALNELETYLRNVARRGGSFTILDVQQLDRDDVERLNAGDVSAMVKITSPSTTGSPPAARVPAADIPSAILQLRDIYERQFTSDSGQSDFDRGLPMSRRETATAAEIMDSRSQTSSSWSYRQCGDYLERVATIVAEIAKRYDRDPIQLDIFGYNVLINDPRDPRSSASTWFDEESEVTINSTDLYETDSARTKNIKIQQHMQLLALVGTTVDPVWYTEQLLQLLGHKDPKEAMMEMQQQGMGQQGMPTDPNMAAAYPMTSPQQAYEGMLGPQIAGQPAGTTGLPSPLAGANNG